MIRPLTWAEQARMDAIEEGRPHSIWQRGITYCPPRFTRDGYRVRGEYRLFWDFNLHCDPTGAGATKE